MGAGVTPQEKQSARDRIAALKLRWERLYVVSQDPEYDDHLPDDPESRLGRSRREYVAALESLVDELTAPEPEDLTRDLERSLVKVRTERACGVKRNVRVAR